MLLKVHKFILVLSLIATLGIIGLNLGNMSEASKLMYSNIAQIALAIIASIFLFLAWKQHPEKTSERRAWLLFGLGMLLWGVGNLVYYLHAQNNAEPGIVFYGYLFFYGTYICFIIAYVSLILDTSYRLSSFSITLASIIFVLGLLSSYFFGLFTPIEIDEFVFSSLFGVLSPVFLSVAILFSMNGLKDKRRSKLTWGLMVVGTICFFVAERGTLLLIHNGSYYSGSVIDTIWLLAFTLFTASGMSSYTRNNQDS